MKEIVFGLLLALWWPFHHRAAAPVAAGPAPLPVVTDHYPDLYCDRDEHGAYWYLGADGLAGVSTKSCDAAIDEWKSETKLPPAANYRA